MTDMRHLDLAGLRPVVAEQPYPMVFATVSGAHLYGFPSRDSDVDLRGVYVLPAEEVVGLRRGPETLDVTADRDGMTLDLVSHDLAKFARLLLRRNGYVLEQVLSPLVVATGPAHAELVALAPACVTRHHAAHYLGFARGQWDLFESTGELKPLLYTARVLLTGLYLMRTGLVQAHLPTLAAELPAQAPAWIGPALQLKAEAEHGPVGTELPPPAELANDVRRLVVDLENARDTSTLPDAPTAEPALHALLVRLRLGHA